MKFSGILAEYVASTNDFPNIRAGFGSTWGVPFQFPDRQNCRFDRKYYLFDTSVKQTTAPVFPKETDKLNKLLETAKEDGFTWLIIHAEASYQEASKTVDEILSSFDARGWFPEDPDMYHDAGYFYSDGYVMTTPGYQYVLEKLQDHRPPIYISGTVIPLTKPALEIICVWVAKRKHLKS